MSLPKREKGSARPIRKPITLRSTNASKALNNGGYDMSSSWFSCREIIASSLDKCKKGSWVFVKSPITVNMIFFESTVKTYELSKGTLITGRIDNILQEVEVSGKASAIIILDVFEISETRHGIYGMPILVRRQSEVTFMIVPAPVRSRIFRSLLHSMTSICRILNFFTMLSMTASPQT